MVKSAKTSNSVNHIAVFQETTIRRTWHNEEWWFALSDVIVVLTDSADPRQCIKKMRSRAPALDANWGTTCAPLPWRLQTARCVKPTAPTPMACFASSSQSRRPRPSRSNAGWCKWVPVRRAQGAVLHDTRQYLHQQKAKR